MKKIILLGCAIICASFTLAQVPTTPETTTAQKAVIAPETTMEGIARNIDRRILYLNRYKKSEDIESLAKLISDENKDFYINFMKYVKASPTFTLKRDTAFRIIKTPTDDYVISGIMSVDGKEKKISITFVEEKSDKGDKWLILDSNLHIQFPLPATSNNLASNTLNNTTPVTTPPTDTTSKPTEEAKPLVTVPVVSKTDTPKNTTVPAPIQKTVSKGLSTMTIIFITLGIIIGIGLGVFGLMKWRRRSTKIVPVMGAVAFATTATSLPEVVNNLPTDATTPPAPVESNVTVSTVEELQSTPPAVTSEDSVPVVVDSAPEENNSLLPEIPTETISEDAALVANENTESAPIVTEELIPSTPVVEVSETETILTTEDTAEESSEIQPATEGNMGTILENVTIPEETITPVMPPVTEEENITPETPTIEAPQEVAVAAIFSHPEEAVTLAHPEIKSLDQIIDDSTKKGLFGEENAESSGNGQPHSLFESIFNPAPPKPETHGLFEDILKSGS